MKNKTRTTLLYSVTFIAIIVAIFFLRRSLNSAEQTQDMIFTPWFLIISLGVFSIQESLNPVFAMLALRSLGQSSHYFPQLQITLFSTSANSTVPVPAGIPIRAYLQKQIIDISYSKSAAGIAIETVIGLGLTCLAALIAGFIWFRQLFDPTLITNNLSTFVLVLVAFCLLFAITFAYLLTKKKHFLMKLRDSLILLFHVRLLPVLGMCLIVVVSFGLAVLRFDMTLRSMGIVASYGSILAALLLARVAGVFSFIPMGLGVRDASLVSLLVLAGVPSSVAIAAAAIDRVIISIPYLFGGIIATHLLSKKILLPE